MLKKFTAVFFLILLLLSTSIKTYSADFLENRIRNTIRILNNYHYRKIDLNEKVFPEIKENFLNSIDPDKIIFTAEDYKILVSTDLFIPADNRKYNLNYYYKTEEIFKKRIIELKKDLSGFENINFDFTDDEKISGYDKYTDNSGITDRWKKLIKYKILDYYCEQTDSESRNFQHFTGLLPSIKQRIIKKEIKNLENLYNQINSSGYLNQIFINSIVGLYDPHSFFMSASQKKNFESALSSKNMSFGIFFTRSISGNLIISAITPGGPAWKSSLLNKNDQLIKVTAFDAQKTVYDTADTDDYILDSILNDSKITKAEFLFKKPGGNIVKTILKKEKLISEENIITGFILDGKKKIGYIYLPAFYTEWEDSGPGCANDITKEVIKLKREGIDGLILDLRGNSGGSVGEALSLAGIFINDGPVYLEQDREMKISIFKDPDRGTVYSGSMAVLVDGQSASASEHVAAILKEYNRAVIVGTKTYGKASTQIFVPVVQNLKLLNDRNYQSGSNTDFLIFTVSLLFNIHGESLQNKGVIPDIVLPFLTDGYFKGEEDLPHSISQENIIKEVTFSPLPELPVKKLYSKSKTRVSKNKNFRSITDINKKLSALFNSEIPLSLNFNLFLKNRIYEESVFQDIDKLHLKSKNFTVKNNKYEEEISSIDEYSAERNKGIIENISNDIYIEETYNILYDLIK
ncbi:MAG: carboxy terminal-processing peptidase [Spirochaetes bacterium]|nr:carboxy terminal-processing peptidase [Spirochaetota bacterium]